jgi:hypothetical protein
VFAQFVSVAISHWHITKYNDTLRLSWSDFKLPAGDLKKTFVGWATNGIPAINYCDWSGNISNRC